MAAVMHLAATLPLALIAQAGATDGILPWKLPRSEDFRLQVISRATREEPWPFSVDVGMLGCIVSLGQRHAFFIENVPPSSDRRQLMLSENPMILLWGNLPHRDLFAAGLNDEELVRRTYPYTRMAMRLCNQPAGTILDDGAL